MSYGNYLYIAHELKKTLNEYMGWDGPTTNRQHLVWVEWLKMQWNAPNRTDHYLMQVAAEVARQWAKHPQSCKLGNFIIQFGGDKPLTPTQRKRQIQDSKDRWLSAVGYNKNGAKT